MKKTEKSTGKKQDGKRIVTLIPGDGIGPEISKSVVDIFSAEGVCPDGDRIVCTATYE